MYDFYNMISPINGEHTPLFAPSQVKHMQNKVSEGSGQHKIYMLS